MSFIFVPILVAFVPALVTYFIPRRFALIWIVVLWAAFITFRYQLDLTDDPALISYAVIFGFFIPVNALATLFRIGEILYELSQRASRGYLDE
jgi:hypothetical protein